MTKTHAKEKVQEMILTNAEHYGYYVHDMEATCEEKEMLMEAGRIELNRIRKLFGFEPR